MPLQVIQPLLELSMNRFRLRALIALAGISMCTAWISAQDTSGRATLDGSTGSANTTAPNGTGRASVTPGNNATPHVIGTPFNGSDFGSASSSAGMYQPPGGFVPNGGYPPNGLPGQYGPTPFGPQGQFQQSPLGPQGLPNQPLPGANQITQDPFQFRLGLEKRVDAGIGYDEGYTHIIGFLPMMVDRNNLWFVEGRAMITDDGDAGGSIGFGRNWYFGARDAVQSASMWFDVDDGHAELYSQMGISYAYLTRWWRFRANGYFVIGDNEQELGSVVDGTSINYLNNNIAVNQAVTSESAYSGYDAEVGGPMPLLGRYGTNWYLGTYFFNAANSEEALGISARFDSQLNEDLSFGVSITDDSAFGTNVQLNVLYQLPNSLAPSRWLRQQPIYQKLAQSTVRKFRVSTKQNVEVVDSLLINPADGLPFEIAHIIPDAAQLPDGSVGGDGTIEDPFISLESFNVSTVDDDADLDIILVRGSDAFGTNLDTNGTGPVTLFENQRFLGAGVTHSILSTIGEFTLPETGVGIAPIISNDQPALAGDFSIEPVVRIESEITTGIRVAQQVLTEVSGFTINGNIENADVGLADDVTANNIGIQSDDSGDQILGFNINRNTFENTLGAVDLVTTGVRHEDIDFDNNLDVAEDIDGDSDLDVDEDANGNGLLDPGEDIDGDGNLDVDEDVDGDGRLDIDEDALANGGNANGVLDTGGVTLADGTTLLTNSGILDQNTVNGAGNDSNFGFNILHSPAIDDNAALLLLISNNTITNVLGEDFDGDFALGVVNEDTNDDGVLQLAEDLDGDFILDRVEDNDGDGVLDLGVAISVTSDAEGSGFDSAIFANNFTGIGAPGLTTGPYGIINNTLDFNASGIEVVSNASATLNSTVVLDFVQNSVTASITQDDATTTDREGFGIRFESNDELSRFVLNQLLNNTINQNQSFGGIFENTGNSITGTNPIFAMPNPIFGNSFNLNGQDGLVMDNDGGLFTIAQIGDPTTPSSNTFTGNEDDGLEIIGDNGAIFNSGNATAPNIIIVTAEFNENGDDGFHAQLDNGSEMDISLGSVLTGVGNTFTDNGGISGDGDGAHFDVLAGSTLRGDVSGNSFNTNAGNGLLFVLDDQDINGVDVASSLLDSFIVQENVASGNSLDGIQFNVTDSFAPDLMVLNNTIGAFGQNGINFLAQQTVFPTAGNTFNNLLIEGNSITGNAVAGGPSNFNIEVVFLGGLTPSQEAIFTLAEQRWESIITGDLPDVGAIDDLQITAEGVLIDGAGGILGQAGPTGLRNDGTFLPFNGLMEFDSADLTALENGGQLVDVILHEMGHVLGIGTIWQQTGNLLNPSNGDGVTDTRFTGASATAAFNAAFGLADPDVPVENDFGPGTADAHWRESVLTNELMTGFLNAGANPLSAITIGSLEDLQYVVDFGQADTFPIQAPITAQTVDLSAFQDVTPSVLANVVANPLGATGNGINFFLDNADTNVTFRDNTVDSVTNIGVNIELVNNSQMLVENFIGNTVTNNGGGGVNVELEDLRTDNDDTTFNMARFSENTIDDNGGIGFNVFATDTLNDPTAQSTIVLNFDNTFNSSTISGNVDAGIGLDLTGNSTAQVLITNMTVANTTDDATTPNFTGQGFGAFLVDDANLDLVIGDPTDVIAAPSTIFFNNDGDGIFVQADSRSTVINPIIQRTSITNNTGDGIHFERFGAAVIGSNSGTTRQVDGLDDGAIFTENTITGNSDGIDILAASNDSLDDYIITFNTIDNNALNGIEMTVQAEADLDVFIADNSIQGNTFDGIQANEVINSAADSRTIFGVIDRNEIVGNGDDGIDFSARSDGFEIGTAGAGNGNNIAFNGTDGINVSGSQVNAMTITNNFIDSNGEDGIDINGAATAVNVDSNLISNNVDDGVEVTGTSLGSVINITTNNNDGGAGNGIVNNGDNGVEVNSLSALSTVTVDNNLIDENLGDGVQIVNSADNGGLAATVTVSNNSIEDNFARGINILNQANGDINVNVNSNEIIRNDLEAVFIMNTSAASQLADTLATVAPEQDGAVVADPRLVFNMDGNTVTDNGVGSGFAGTGLVIRVGTSDALTGAGNINNDGGLFADGRGGVGANVTNNVFSGHRGGDVYFDAFISTVDPVTTAGTWDDQNDGDATNDVFVVNTFEQDPLARLDLVFSGNTGQELIATPAQNGNVFYNNNEEEFKSRINNNVAVATPAGPFDSGTRARNATRLASRDAPFAAPGLIIGNSDDFLYPGTADGPFGPGSSFRVNEFGNAFITGGGSFGNTVDTGAGFGELVFYWDPTL